MTARRAAGPGISAEAAAMIVLAAKVLLGTVLYVAVLWEARRNPRAAGMMLTFPTLNGIGMLMAQPAALGPIVGSMLLMPIVNALFCAIYLAAFERAVRAGAACRPPARRC